MTFEALNDEQSGAVVGTSRIGVSQAAKWLICLVIALMCALWITPCAFAEGEGTLTENITDPQNLLGSNVSAVTDKIKETKQQSGVTVRLLYVESFGTEVNPTKWASGVLESLSPKPNTVLLAVASGDGKLVVVASGNSEDWLRNSKTMDALSEAATDKLAKSGAQDWSGAAIAMMDQIMLLKKTSTSGSLSKIAVIVLMCVVVVLIVGTIVFVVLRNRRRRKEAELDAARAAAGKRTRANRRGHAVGHAAESASRSRGRRGEEHGRGRRGKRSSRTV
ncbi:TPM domain-containing protein [Bifidobacterium angulatum]|uniref:TPM domain-containing protein n=1 Tax=Bifidobacterium angulatum TaxID=1683 RepID=UPI002E783F60|nr:TPM domain-containing protein [Bifidobacterium angulatum]MEE0331647.1 TPM domain-containing protein [Bifidobacterium angulatum]